MVKFGEDHAVACKQDAGVCSTWTLGSFIARVNPMIRRSVCRRIVLLLAAERRWTISLEQKIGRIKRHARGTTKGRAEVRRISLGFGSRVRWGRRLLTAMMFNDANGNDDGNDNINGNSNLDVATDQ